MANEKNAVQKSEAWLSAIVVIGALLTTYLQGFAGSEKWVAAGVAITLAAVYSVFKTGLASADRPGVQTKAFWVALAGVGASIAAALSDLQLPGVSSKVTQVASMVATAAVALGYNVWRFKSKMALPLAVPKPAAVADTTPVTQPLKKV